MASLQQLLSSEQAAAAASSKAAEQEWSSRLAESVSAAAAEARTAAESEAESRTIILQQQLDDVQSARQVRNQSCVAHHLGCLAWRNQHSSSGADILASHRRLHTHLPW